MTGSDQLPRTLSEYYSRARSGMSPHNRAYFLAGSGDEQTAAANEAAFLQAQVTPRMLRDLRGGSTEMSLLGQKLAAPLLIAPFAYQRLLHDEGETATARGAEAQSIKMVLSAQSSEPIEKVRANSSGSDWFQLHWMGDRENTQALAQMALAAGYNRLILTVDAPVQGVRDQEIEAQFQLPPDVSAVNLAQFTPPRITRHENARSVIFDHIAETLPTWEDVVWLIESLQAPLLLKGILHPEDAAQAQRIGAAGIIVSNHGGRVLDRAPATLSALPSIIDKVGPDYPVLLDGGIRRGVDILIALALGAKAVLVGRPIACGLAVAGDLGVSHVLRLLRDELEIAMLLSGCATVEDIHREMVHLKL